MIDNKGNNEYDITARHNKVFISANNKDRELF